MFFLYTWITFSVTYIITASNQVFHTPKDPYTTSYACSLLCCAMMLSLFQAFLLSPSPFSKDLPSFSSSNIAISLFSLLKCFPNLLNYVWFPWLPGDVDNNEIHLNLSMFVWLMFFFFFLLFITYFWRAKCSCCFNRFSRYFVFFIFNLCCLPPPSLLIFSIILSNWNFLSCLPRFIPSLTGKKIWSLNYSEMDI